MLKYVRFDDDEAQHCCFSENEEAIVIWLNLEFLNQVFWGFKIVSDDYIPF